MAKPLGPSDLYIDYPWMIHMTKEFQLRFGIGKSWLGKNRSVFAAFPGVDWKNEGHQAMEQITATARGLTKFK